MSNFTFPDPNNAQEAAFQARIAERGKNLFEHGYTFQIVTGLLAGHYYRVNSPKGESYVVDPLIRKCNCPCFEKNEICKHAVAIDLFEKEAESCEMGVETYFQWARENGLYDF